MTYLISEGTRTAWGGRTVRLEIVAPPDPLLTRPVNLNPPKVPHVTETMRMRAKRNKRIQSLYLAGFTAGDVAEAVNLSDQAIYHILRSMGTKMRPAGKRRA